MGQATLIFVDELPDNTKGRYAHYEHQRLKIEGWEYCDIREYIGHHQEQWLDYVEHWYARLSECILKHSSWWWLMPYSRLRAWSPPLLKPIFFAIAVIEYCEKQDLKELYLVRCPIDVCDYIKEARPDFRVSFVKDVEKSKSGLIGTVFNRCLEYARPIKELFTLAMQNLLNNRIKKTNLTGAKIFVYSHVLTANLSINGRDHFFGNMFDHIPNLDKKDIVWLYFSQLKKERRTIIQNLKSRGYKYVILQDLLTLPDVIKVVWVCLFLFCKLRPARNKLPALKINNYKSFILPRKFFHGFIESTLPIDEMTVYFLVKRLLKQSSVKVIIYPYEEKGLERAIIRAVSEIGRRIYTIGFAHGVSHQGHLYLRNRYPHLINSPKPDIIAATGPAARKWLIDWAYVKPDRITIFGSDRYAGPLAPIENYQVRQGHLRVLLIGGMPYELDILANFVNEAENLFDNCEILIRKNPYVGSNEQNRGIARLRKQLKNMRVESGSLRDQFSWCDVSVFSSSSAGIDAMLSGRMAIYVELHDIFVMNPLYGKGDLSKVMCCATHRQLKDRLNQIRRMSDEEYNLSAQKQREFASQIFSPVNSKGISQLISSCTRRDTECPIGWRKY